MWLNKIKWMAVGVALTLGIVFIYQNRSYFSTFSKNDKHPQLHKINPEFAGYISAFTAGYVSSGSSIKIKLSSEFAGSTQLNNALTESYFTFDPAIEGETVWKDGQTMEFKPKTRLMAGQKYSATFHLGKLLEVKKELKDFKFYFQTVQQSMQMQLHELKTYNAADFRYYNLTGNIMTADYAESQVLEKTLQATFNNKNLLVKWTHLDNGRTHLFIIDSIERAISAPSTLNIHCDSKTMGLSYVSTQTLSVPARSSFVLLNTKVINDNDQFVLLTFSNPIEQSQSLEGLVDLDKTTETKYLVTNNQVAVYPAGIKSGSHKITVREGIKDAKNQVLRTTTIHNLVFNETKPAVKFSGDGNILPSGNNMSLSFETVNLLAVDVKIIRIYENNVLQFLQNNELDGSSQLAQVGKKVAEKRINLGITNPADFGVWKKSSLDLSSLIKAEHGAIYRVVMNFRKSYSTYPCIGNVVDDKFEMEEMKESEEEEENYYYSYYYDDYGYNSYDEEENDGGYNYEDRNNPCKSTYYRQYNRTVAKNILASDLGLTVKRGNDGSLFAAVNDLLTAKPLGGISLELYDYQKQLIHTAMTNSDGQAHIDIPQKTYFIVAKNDKQRAYLKLDDGAALALSMYDVSGDAVKKGVKGFIYGERGVWRPGDSLFLNFILEDKMGNIPTNHPVTFELSNPQGQLYKRMLSNKSINGFYNFSTATDKNAPTGLWTAEVKVGSLNFSKSIRIEAIMPNRLKIDVNVGDNKLLLGTQANTIRLHTNWLTGAVAKRLSTNITVALSAGKTNFPKFKDFIFDDATQQFEAQNIVIFNDKVDDEGNASVPLDLNLQKNAAGFLKATFNTMVFEQGGAFSVDRFSLPYSPFAAYSGVKLPAGEKNSGILYTGKDHTIEVATVDANGNGVSRPNMKFELYKMEWRWWWDQYNDELANYVSDDYHKPVQIQSFASLNGRAKININIAEEDWGRYLIRIIDVDGGHSTSTVAFFDWANWMDRDGGGDNKVLSNMLSFTTDKQNYKTGEQVSINIPTPQNGRALVTIENGTKVLEAHWLETTKGNTSYKFKVTPLMAPNIYVHVSLMQPHARTNDLPIRLYGVVPVNIIDPETHLRPIITIAKTLIPEQQATIVVSEENNREMAFTLAVVDEGLLDITRYKTPDPYSAFYAREALGVKTWDLYDHVIGAYGAELERVLSIGGDGTELSKDGAKANRFKPMIKFFGPYHLSKNEKKTIKFKMPMYTGSVRAMVIAGNKGAYGSDEKTSTVKAPLMILGTLPRVLSVTEEVKLPVSVFGGEKTLGNVSVKVEVNGLLQTVGGNSKTVSIGKNDEQLVTFNLKVKDRTGIAKVKITASGGGQQAVYDIELDVRNPNPTQTNSKDLWIDAGKSVTEHIHALGLPGTNTGMLELSSIPPINLEERLHYLIAYPHGCVEQTTSQTFAQLYLDEIMELSPQIKASIETNIRHGISEIRKFQLPSGGLSYWQGTNETSEWGTSYAGHFLLSAEKKGYALPPGFKKDWITYQQTTAQNFEVNKNKYFNNDMQQAYRLYVLALANQPAMSAMNRLREYKNLTGQARWLLAAAYAQAGQANEALKLVAATSLTPENYKVDYETFGSSERDMAIVLEALCLMNKKTQALEQLKKVSAFLSSKTWLSTQTTAFGLVSVASFIKKFGGSSAMQAECTINGKQKTIKGNQTITQLPVDFKNNKDVSFSLKNNGKGLLYVRLVSRGKPAIGEEKELSANLLLTATYKNLDGSLIDPTEMTQGSNFLLSVTVKNTGHVGEVKNIALTNYIPSGWEIHNARMDDNETAMKSSAFTYQDIRDDKVLTYFDLRYNESKTFNLLLNSTYEGRYYLPALNVEAMYDNTVYARTRGQWIRVVK